MDADLHFSDDLLNLVLDELLFIGEKKAYDRLLYLCRKPNTELLDRHKKRSRPLVLKMKATASVPVAVPIKVPYGRLFEVHWGDGDVYQAHARMYFSKENGVDDEPWMHYYKEPGVYTVRVFPVGDAVNDELWSLTNFELTRTHSPKRWFDNLVEIVDLGTLGPINMDNWFAGGYRFNLPLNHLDVSQVIHMEETFKECVVFNQPLNKWDVSNVTTMAGLFQDAHRFNQDISMWDVSKVRIMSRIFFNATSFNQNLSSWNVVSVILLDAAFGGHTQVFDVEGWLPKVRATNAMLPDGCYGIEELEDRIKAKKAIEKGGARLFKPFFGPESVK